MAKAKKQQAAADRRQLEQEIHLVKAPGALAKEKEEKLKGACCRLLGHEERWSARGRAGVRGCAGWSRGAPEEQRETCVPAYVRVCVPHAQPPPGPVLPCSCGGGGPGGHAGVRAGPPRGPPSPSRPLVANVQQPAHLLTHATLRHSPFPYVLSLSVCSILCCCLPFAAPTAPPLPSWPTAAHPFYPLCSSAALGAKAASKARSSIGRGSGSGRAVQVKQRRYEMQGQQGGIVYMEQAVLWIVGGCKRHWLGVWCAVNR